MKKLFLTMICGLLILSLSSCSTTTTKLEENKEEIVEGNDLLENLDVTESEKVAMFFVASYLDAYNKRDLEGLKELNPNFNSLKDEEIENYFKSIEGINDYTLNYVEASDEEDGFITGSYVYSYSLPKKYSAEKRKNYQIVDFKIAKDNEKYVMSSSAPNSEADIQSIMGLIEESKERFKTDNLSELLGFHIDTNSSQDTSNSEPTEYKSFTSKNNEFTVSYPDKWLVSEGNNAWLFDPYGGDENIIAVDKIMINKAPAKGKDVETYANDSIKSLQSKYEDMEIEKGELQEFDGFKRITLYTEHDYTSSSKQLGEFTIMKNDDYFYIFQFYTLDHNYEEFIDIKNIMLNTFKFNDK